MSKVKISGCFECDRVSDTVVVDRNKVRCNKYLTGNPTDKKCKDTVTPAHCPLYNTLRMFQNLPDLTFEKVKTALNIDPIKANLDTITVLKTNFLGKTTEVLKKDGWEKC